MKHWWNHNWIKVALVFLFLFTSAGFYKVERERNSREDSVNHVLLVTCQGGNKLRTGLRKYFITQIIQAEHTNPNFFPNIPAETFKELLEEQVGQLHYDIHHRFNRVHCSTERIPK